MTARTAALPRAAPASAAMARHGALPPGHVPDLLAANLAIVFCGTALGRASAERRAYYAHPGNRFWRTLHETGLTPARLRPDEWPQLVAHGIGLTDVCKSHFGNDDTLPPDAFDPAALCEKIALHRPAVLAFTSKAAAAATLARPTRLIGYGFLGETMGATRLAVLPSPSGAAARHWDVAVWHALAAATAPRICNPL